ncbi:hypothetical protein ABIA33_000998 [Streptacidiphilus sp. MAP12-16]
MPEPHASLRNGDVAGPGGNAAGQAAGVALLLLDELDVLGEVALDDDEDEESPDDVLAPLEDFGVLTVLLADERLSVR